jgi:hypothetical protein
VPLEKIGENMGTPFRRKEVLGKNAGIENGDFLKAQSSKPGK